MHVLLQIQTLQSSLQSGGVISVSKPLAEAFKLQSRKEVILCIVTQDRERVTLELVELTIKGQYIGRSDMWRVKNQLTNSLVYVGKDIRRVGPAGALQAATVAAAALPRADPQPRGRRRDAATRECDAGWARCGRTSARSRPGSSGPSHLPLPAQNVPEPSAGGAAYGIARLPHSPARALRFADTAR